MARTWTHPITNPTCSSPATAGSELPTLAQLPTPSACPKLRMRPCGTLLCSTTRTFGLRMVRSRLSGRLGIQKGTPPTLTTCLAGRVTRCRGPWIPTASSNGARWASIQRVCSKSRHPRSRMLARLKRRSKSRWMAVSLPLSNLCLRPKADRQLQQGLTTFLASRRLLCVTKRGCFHGGH